MSSVYNVKRRIASLEPIALPTFESQVAVTRGETGKSLTDTESASDSDGKVDDEPSAVEYNPLRCLFCNRNSSDSESNLDHMLKKHGLFIPDPQHLAIDQEALIKYMSLVIFEHQECLFCGTTRSSISAIQQHMTGKGHCKFSIDDEGSEFRELYSFSDDENAIRSGPSKLPLPIDHELRLPSGKILSSRSSTFTHHQRINRSPSSQSKRHAITDGNNQPEDTADASPSNQQSKQLIAHQRASDRTALIGLPEQQQRLVLATQKRMQKEEVKAKNYSEARVERIGNKQKHYRAAGPSRPNG